MNSPFLSLRLALAANPRTWLVTGAAGFIGSNLTETLLELDQKVVGLDNLATGHLRNLDQIKAKVSPSRWSNFKFIQGDISNLDDCRAAVISPFDDKQAVTYVLHQAALGSVPRSLADPITTNSINIGGFLNMLVAARDAGVASFVYAASSSTYGDSPHLPKTEAVIGNPLSPYAVTKYVNELYADVFARSYGFKTIGLRYFNVFGPRQDPNGAYAAVIPRWISALVNGTPVQINGDGETSRDFCYIANVVQANLLAATSESPEAWNQVYNVAIGDQTDLNTLFRSIQSALEREIPNVREQKPIHSGFRAGDVRHSRADISKAERLLGYAPTHRFSEGLISTVEWHLDQSRKAANHRKV